MGLAMDIAALCCSSEHGTNGCHLYILSLHVAFAPHFMATHPPYRSASSFGYASKNYLQWRTIQLAIHSMVG